MTIAQLGKFRFWRVIFPCVFLACGLFSYTPTQSLVFSTDQFILEIDPSGFLTGFQSKLTKKNYLPKGGQSPLLSLVKGGEYLRPTGFSYNQKKKTAMLRYANGASAEVKIESKGSYIRLELLAVNNRNGVEVAMWGPYPTTISKLIGETIGVVRDDEFAIGIQSLNINTIEGIPDDGDNAGGGSFYDPLPGQKLPEALSGKLGQPVSTDVNGDGDMPEYIRQYRGTAAVKKPYGSELRFYARDRRLPRSVKMGEQMQAVMPVNSDMVGSAIALFGCAEPNTLDVIEKIELGEGLPHPILQGKWVKRSPKTSDAYMLYEGKNLDQCLVYARDLNFKLVHIGDVFKSWGHFGLDTKRFDGAAAIRNFTDKARKDGISVGIHTLTTFTQVHDPYVSPVPNDSLQISGRALLMKDLSPDDLIIEVEDPEPFRNPSGTRTIKIGKELISYKAVSAVQPWQLTGVVRGQFKTVKGAHRAGMFVDKLVNNGYGGFLPDISLQDQYAKRLAQVCNETSIDLMDFDGFEALDATGHGTFAENKFIDLWYKNLDRYRMTCGSKPLITIGTFILT